MGEEATQTKRGSFVGRRQQNVDQSLHICTLEVELGNGKFIRDLPMQWTLCDLRMPVLETLLDLGFDVYCVEKGRGRQHRSMAFYAECRHALRALETIGACVETRGSTGSLVTNQQKASNEHNEDP